MMGAPKEESSGVRLLLARNMRNQCEGAQGREGGEGVKRYGGRWRVADRGVDPARSQLCQRLCAQLLTNGLALGFKV